jgi:hypothetical protein
MHPKLSISKTGPGAAKVQADIDRVLRHEVLVGIPAATTIRRGDKINNASLLYILTHGSAVRNIPATPVIEPAIVAEGNRQAIVKELKQSAQAALQDNPTQAMLHLRRAGQAGANAAILWFKDPRNNWPPNAPSTIRRKGFDSRNIDTGALRKSLTFVVRKAS